MKRNEELLHASLGGEGGVYITDTSEHTPSKVHTVFVGIQPITDCVVTLVGNISGITSVSLIGGGAPIVGRYTSCTLASGTAIAYEGL